MTVQPNRGSRRDLVAALGNGGALLVGLLLCYGALALQGGFDLRGLDIFFYYCVSHLVVVGHGADIYSLRALRGVELAFSHGFSIPAGVVPNAYPPWFVLLLAPLAVFPYTLAYFLWLGVNCLLLGVAFVGLERIARLQGRGAFIFRMLAVISLPILLALLHGQASILMLVCLVLALLALEGNHEVWAGLALAGLTAKPQYLPALILTLLLLRRLRAVLAFAAGSAALLILPVLVLGVSSIPNWFHTLLTARSWGNRPGFASPAGNRGITGQVSLLLHGRAAQIATLLLCGLLVLLLVWVVLRTQRLDLSLGLATIVALLISPHVLIHDLSLLAVPAALALRYRQGRGRALAAVLAVSYVLVLVGFGVAMFAPLQLTVPAMLLLGAWLLVVAQSSRVSQALPAGYRAERSVG